MSKTYIREACVESLEQAIKAEQKGADRLELCAYLAFDGLTPAPDLIKAVVGAVHIPVRVMIRPRSGGFCYNEEELEHMERCIGFCKDLGVEGVVFGALNESGTLNLEALEQLIQVSKPLKVVIHKAIDETPDLAHSLNELLNLKGVDTVLTSGGKSNAFDGSENLLKMMRIAGDSLEIMPAGKITQFNLTELDHILGASAYHGKLIVGELQ